MKKKQTLRKPSTLELLASAAEQDHQDLSTMDVVRRRAVLSYDAEVQESEIAELRSRLSEGQKRLGRLNAQISGLTRIVEKR